MPQPLFDVFFRGALVANADPGEVRNRLAVLFGLSPGELDRLFAGATVCVERAVDVETASELRGRFRDAGALVDIRPTETAAKASPAPPTSAAVAPAAVHPESAPAGGAGLTLVPTGTSLADAATPPPPAIDTSHLSVAPPNTGSLEDCRQEKPARPIGDISHLRLTDD